MTRLILLPVRHPVAATISLVVALWLCLAWYRAAVEWWRALRR